LGNNTFIIDKTEGVAVLPQLLFSVHELFDHLDAHQASMICVFDIKDQ